MLQEALTKQSLTHSGLFILAALLRVIFILLLGKALLVGIFIDRITIERLWTD